MNRKCAVKDAIYIHRAQVLHKGNGAVPWHCRERSVLSLL